MKSYTTLDAIGDILVIYGIVIVVSMLVALVIRGIVWALSRQVKEGVKPAVAKPVAVSPSPSPPEVDIPQEHLAAIGAAVAAMLGVYRIVRIETPVRGHAWTAEARTVHHTSHAPRASH